MSVIATKKTVLPTPDFSQMLNQLESIISSFDPRLTKMTPEQRKTRSAVGIRRKGFIDMVQAIVSKNNDLMPGYLNLDDFNSAAASVNEIMLLQNSVRKLAEYLRNAEILVSNETYRSSLGVYRMVRDAALNGVSGAKPLYQRLKKQFTRRTRPAAHDNAGVTTVAV